MNPTESISTLRTVVTSSASWVLFENGTVVFLPSAQPDSDLSLAAQDILREHGPVHIGSPSGDFDPIELENNLGWIVSFDHPDILTLVAPDEIEADASEIQVGLLGRSKRGEDAQTPHVVHVEDRRTN